MTDQLIAGGVLLALCVLLYWRMARVGRKPRMTPKIPRDRRFDEQLFFWIGFRF